jgi:hypothetical protein
VNLRDSAQIRRLAPYFVSGVFALLGGVGTHYMDRQNWVSQHREEQLDARRQEATRVFDTTIVMLSRISISSNKALWGFHVKVPRDSLTKLVGAFDTDAYNFETQIPHLQSLIKAYFDSTTEREFFSLGGLLIGVEDQVDGLIRPGSTAGGDPSNLRSFSTSIFALSDRMERQVADYGK